MKMEGENANCIKIVDALRRVYAFIRLIIFLHLFAYWLAYQRSSDYHLGGPRGWVGSFHQLGLCCGDPHRAACAEQLAYMYLNKQMPWDAWENKGEGGREKYCCHLVLNKSLLRSGGQECFIQFFSQSACNENTFEEQWGKK